MLFLLIIPLLLIILVFILLLLFALTLPMTQVSLILNKGPRGKKYSIFDVHILLCLAHEVLNLSSCCRSNIELLTWFYAGRRINLTAHLFMNGTRSTCLFLKLELIKGLKTFEFACIYLQMM